MLQHGAALVSGDEDISQTSIAVLQQHTTCRLPNAYQNAAVLQPRYGRLPSGVTVFGNRQ
jgi:hypothetical protein